VEAERINRVSGRILIILSLIALFTVLTGYLQQPQPDEGTGAHIFQISVVAALPTGLLFLITADSRRRGHNARTLAISAATLLLAFGALYYLEHYWWR
jgi:Na+/H+ antiporter NhaD/arsenite permease-like protein